MPAKPNNQNGWVLQSALNTKERLPRKTARNDILIVMMGFAHGKTFWTGTIPTQPILFQTLSERSQESCLATMTKYTVGDHPARTWLKILCQFNFKFTKILDRGAIVLLPGQRLRLSFKPVSAQGLTITGGKLKGLDK
ncbi:MAG: hypothetical protein WA116_09050 [Anaerolineaceae bacterium]